MCVNHDCEVGLDSTDLTKQAMWEFCTGLCDFHNLWICGEIVHDGRGDIFIYYYVDKDYPVNKEITKMIFNIRLICELTKYWLSYHCNCEWRTSFNCSGDYVKLTSRMVVIIFTLSSCTLCCLGLYICGWAVAQVSNLWRMFNMAMCISNEDAKSYVHDLKVWGIYLSMKIDLNNHLRLEHKA